MALPLGRVKGTRETPHGPLHHSDAALPAERDAQERFLSGGCLSDSFDGDVETLMKFTNSEVEGFACAHRLSCADGWCRYKASTPHAVMVDASLSIERSINLRGSAEKIFQHRVYPGGDHALDQVLGVEPTNCPCDI